MKTSIQTRPRIGDLPRRRRRKKQPDSMTQMRVEWLEWLVAEYGADAVADWQQPAVSFREWKRIRELAAHEAA